MSASPLDEPHLAALRWACERVSLYGIRDALVTAGEMLGDDAGATAIRAISSPASAASLVRDLLARAGVEDHDVWHEPIGPIGGPGGLIIQCGDDEEDGYEVLMPDVPRFISALCDLAPGDREGAMRVLREVGK